MAQPGEDVIAVPAHMFDKFTANFTDMFGDLEESMNDQTGGLTGAMLAQIGVLQEAPFKARTLSQPYVKRIYLRRSIERSSYQTQATKSDSDEV